MQTNPRQPFLLTHHVVHPPLSMLPLWPASGRQGNLMPGSFRLSRACTNSLRLNPAFRSARASMSSLLSTRCLRISSAPAPASFIDLKQTRAWNNWAMLVAVTSMVCRIRLRYLWRERDHHVSNLHQEMQPLAEYVCTVLRFWDVVSYVCRTSHRSRRRAVNPNLRKSSKEYPAWANAKLVDPACR